MSERNERIYFSLPREIGIMKKITKRKYNNYLNRAREAGVIILRGDDFYSRSLTLTS